MSGKAGLSSEYGVDCCCHEDTEGFRLRAGVMDSPKSVHDLVNSGDVGGVNWVGMLS